MVKRGRELTVCLLVHAGLDAGDAVPEAGLGRAQARVRGCEVFEFLRQAGLEGGELWGGEGEDVDGAGGEVLELCHFIAAFFWEGSGVGVM